MITVGGGKWTTYRLMAQVGAGRVCVGYQCVVGVFPVCGRMRGVQMCTGSGSHAQPPHCAFEGWSWHGYRGA